jgi:hypothetical protein
MEKEIVTFKGISRNTDSGISDDGYCAELINGRIAGGSIVPMGKPVIKHRFGKSYDKIFKHVGSGFENLICAYGYDVDAYIKQEGDETYSQLKILAGDSEIKSIESIGNTLSVITAGGIIYFLFKNGGYYNIGSQPEMPVINFRLEFVEQKEESSGWIQFGNYEEDISAVVDENGEEYAYLLGGSKKIAVDTVNGLADKLSTEASEKGLFISPVIVRYAIKLYDGTYIKQSPPILILPPEKETLTGRNMPYIEPGGFLGKNRVCKEIKFTVAIKKYKLTYDISSLNNLQAWKDLILGVDVFISHPISQYDLNYDFEDEMTPRFGIEVHDIKPHLYEDAKIKEKIIETSTFYYIKKISISEPELDGTLSKESALDNLEQKETLSDDDFTNIEITGEVSYVYNSKLHLANITRRLFDGYNLKLFSNRSVRLWGEVTGTLPTPDYVLVDINTEQGTKTVKSTPTILAGYGLVPYLSYPDTRATKMTIVLKKDGVTYYKEFPLKPHPYLNLAYYFEELKAITFDRFTVGEPAYKIDNLEKNSNVIRVSETNNPFYFPAKNTYSPSAYEVIAMCSNTEPIDTGQFGQYPLYVFCKDGIYSLSVDTSGATTYNISSPVSRDVCTNPNVCPLDKAVAFITDAGLMIVAGGTTTLLSQEIDGWLPTMFKNNPVFDKTLKIGKLENSKSAVRFRDFIKNATIGFMYEEREIIVSNPGYNYSYVYSFNSGYWNKISKRIDFYVKTYPECWGVVKSEESSCIYNMYNPGESVNNIAIITRPVKLGSLSHKRLYQFSLRCLLYTARGQLKFRGEPLLFRGEEIFIFGRAGFYVLGSNDAEHFEVIGGKDNFLETRDIISNMNRSKAYKYFIFCLAGTIKTTSFINILELLVDTSFTNRLR